MKDDGKYNDFRDLEVWQRCRVIRKKIWELTKRLPLEERYRLSDQMIRSSRSSTACIAEGYGRFHFQENIQFCRQSRGSLYELIDHTLVAEESDCIDHRFSRRTYHIKCKRLWNNPAKNKSCDFSDFQKSICL
ncbi:MAG TPA: four helix bundle protein [Deltaproteobacteria bacterium]|nr:four helix bundle protein [Deltaproteobacteria bacterium]